MEEVVAPIAQFAPYEPGRFYRRELPCLLTALEAITARPATVIMDGYVWLDGEGREPAEGPRKCCGARAARRCTSPPRASNVQRRPGASAGCTARFASQRC